MKRYFFIPLLVLLALALQTTAQITPDHVIVLPVKMTMPAGARLLGSIKLGNNATQTHCDYEAMIAAAKSKAAAMGGNLVKITRLIEPAFISKCYKIEAQVYHVDQIPSYEAQKIAAPAPAAGNHATLYIYRLKDTIALASSYKIHMNNDSVICTVKSRSRDSVYIYQEGPLRLWGKTEKEQELRLNITFGSVYYIRCGLVHGELRAIPDIKLVDEQTGAKEYGYLLNKKKDLNAKYLDQIH